MQDHWATNGNEPLIIEPSSQPVQPARPARVRIARLVSNILAPSTISLPFILLVALYRAPNMPEALIYGIITLFFLSFGPLFYIIICVRLGKISDVEVSRRAERAGPFLFGITSVVLGWLALTLLHGPRNLQTVLIITSVSGIVMMVTTLWWKISIHASSLGGAATVLTVLYGGVMLPTFALLILVSWSRVVLRRHTVSQVVVGSLLSIVLSLFILKLRGI